MVETAVVGAANAVITRWVKKDECSRILVVLYLIMGPYNVTGSPIDILFSMYIEKMRKSLSFNVAVQAFKRGVGVGKGMQALNDIIYIFNVF